MGFSNFKNLFFKLMVKIIKLLLILISFLGVGIPGTVPDPDPYPQVWDRDTNKNFESMQIRS
jgi:hypothetical protein